MTIKIETCAEKHDSPPVYIKDCTRIGLDFTALPVFRKNVLEDIFSVSSKSVPVERRSSLVSMADVVATPLREKRGRSKAVAFSDFFGAKVKTLLLRTRSVVQALPPKISGASVGLLADLTPFADAGSVEDVLEKLGGEECLASQIFVSVMDESERWQLDLMRDSAEGSSRS